MFFCIQVIKKSCSQTSNMHVTGRRRRISNSDCEQVGEFMCKRRSYKLGVKMNHLLWIIIFKSGNKHYLCIYFSSYLNGSQKSCRMIVLLKKILNGTNQKYYNMLPIEKNKDIIEQIRRVISRAEHVRQVKNQLFSFINEVQKLNSTFSQKISREMTKFEQFIIKNSLYYQKTDHIVNLSKLYREFSVQIQRNSKINLISMQNIKQQNIEKLQEKLKNKCQGCVKQFQKYSQQEFTYNQKFTVYNLNCDQLTKIITMYKSYENPISFYQKILTNEYLSALDKKYQQCSTNQSQIVTFRQMIDQQRGNLTQHIKDVNENYFLFVHSYLDIIQKIIKCIVYPKNEGKLEKTELNLRAIAQKDNIQQHQLKQLQRLENLYSNEAGKNNQNNLFEEFAQLFRKSVNQNEISSDHRFFYDRCSSIRSKKLKTSEQTYKLQTYLFDELKLQRQSYYQYEKSYKQIQKDIFKNNGVQSYKKRFRKYFGANYAQMLQLCLNLIERQKKSLQKICKNMEQGHQKMKKILENKKQTIIAFQKRSNIILQDHLKIKEKTFSRETIDSQQLHKFKTSITQSFNQLKKVFMELQKSQREDDKRYFINLKSLYETIMKEATNKNLNKLLDKQKNRINILNNISIDRETLSILKEDTRYQNLLNQCPKPNLYTTFVSLINKTQVQQTTLLLKKKETRLKNMIKPKLGCCGMKSEVIKQKVHSQHDCKLRDQKQKYKGVINISELGLIFEESTWNPFSQGLQLVVPQSDIKSFDIKQFQKKQVVQIQTQFGALHFQSKENGQILKSIQNNINFKPIKQISQRGKRNDSSSFIKNNTSTQFKISFDKTLNSNELSNVIKNVNSKMVPEKNNSKPKSIENQLKDLARKWRDGQFFSAQKFTRVQKPQKNEMRRDYHYKQGHSKFYLKQRRECRIVDKDLIMKYQWKISFPESPMLHSFKHHQEIRVENAAKELRIRVISAKFFEEQLYIKNKFYKQIDDMNTLICQFIVVLLQKEADIIKEQEEDQRKSMQSFNIVIDDINIQQRDSKFQKTQSLIRNSRLQKARSTSVLNKNSI